MTGTPKTRQPADHALCESRRQYYDAARQARLMSLPDLSEAGHLTRALTAFIDDAGRVPTTESVAAMVLTLAALGLKALPQGTKLEKLADRLYASAAEDVIDAAVTAAERRQRDAKKALKSAPDHAHMRSLWQEARMPAFLAHLTGAGRAVPWDAAHDGHLTNRDGARAAGLVRWARALTAERSERITQAMSEACVLQGTRAAYVWADRRPIVAINKLNTYVTKLVSDAWLADPRTAVLWTGPDPVQGTPFASWDIPVIDDRRHFVRALFALEHFPCVIEPRLGGFTVTAATGLVDVRGLSRVTELPAWCRTLAEIALIDRCEAAVNSKVQRPADWLARYRALLAVTPAVPEQPKTALMEKVREQRGAFLELREDVTRMLKNVSDLHESPVPDPASHRERASSQAQRRRQAFRPETPEDTLS